MRDSALLPTRQGGGAGGGRPPAEVACPDDNWVRRGCSGGRKHMKVCCAWWPWGHPSGRMSSVLGALGQGHSAQWRRALYCGSLSHCALSLSLSPAIWRPKGLGEWCPWSPGSENQQRCEVPHNVLRKKEQSIFIAHLATGSPSSLTPHPPGA